MKRLILLIFVIFLASCDLSDKDLTAEEKNEALRTTATNYWELRMEGKYDETYKLEKKEGLPASKEEYDNKARAIKKINITKHEIKAVRMEGEKGEVDVEFTCVFPMIGKPVKQPLKDEWVWRKGKWKHIFR